MLYSLQTFPPAPPRPCPPSDRLDLPQHPPIEDYYGSVQDDAESLYQSVENERDHSLAASLAGSRGGSLHGSLAGRGGGGAAYHHSVGGEQQQQQQQARGPVFHHSMGEQQVSFGSRSGQR